MKKIPKIPWNNLQSLIWLVGIGILFITGDWWPGILLVVAISILAEFILQRLAQSQSQNQ